MVCWSVVVRMQVGTWFAGARSFNRKYGWVGSADPLHVLGSGLQEALGQLGGEHRPLEQNPQSHQSPAIVRRREGEAESHSRRYKGSQHHQRVAETANHTRAWIEGGYDQTHIESDNITIIINKNTINHTDNDIRSYNRHTYYKDDYDNTKMTYI